ncbi:MAG: lipid asymmetry maintenance ABC transporter permease subunit MlaE [Proteobacteria bacterium]|nr:lipid asymmetry maintenance ABC transporter permease subunit MlaE [Pseudomonadota bacterium]
MINYFQKLGKSGLNFCEQLGISGIFLIRAIFCRPKWSQAWPLFAAQLYKVGVLSLLIILVSALFIGMVVALQGFNTLRKFGAEQELGQLVALSVVRELGPVVAALLFAGRAGSALTAELGLMRATQQINGMEMMAVDPMWRVVAPRLWAGFVAMPALAVLFNMVAIMGGHFVGVTWLGVDNGAFWSNMQDAVNFKEDILNGIIKSLVFGFIITWVAIFQGFHSAPNAAGISRATTRTVVFSSLLILALDFVLTSLMMGGW